MSQKNQWWVLLKRLQYACFNTPVSLAQFPCQKWELGRASVKDNTEYNMRNRTRHSKFTSHIMQPLPQLLLRSSLFIGIPEHKHLNIHCPWTNSACRTGGPPLKSWQGTVWVGAADHSSESISLWINQVTNIPEHLPKPKKHCGTFDSTRMRLWFIYQS